MNAQTRFSSRGQVVIPKDVRERYGFDVGDTVDVIEMPDGVMLKAARSRKRLTVEEAVTRFRELYTHVGPPASLEEMDAAVAEAVREKWAGKL